VLRALVPMISPHWNGSSPRDEKSQSLYILRASIPARTATCSLREPPRARGYADRASR